MPADKSFYTTKSTKKYRNPFVSFAVNSRALRGHKHKHLNCHSNDRMNWLALDQGYYSFTPAVIFNTLWLRSNDTFHQH